MQQILLHFLDPVLLLCHVPVELPKQARLFKPGPPFHSKFDELSVGILKSLNPLNNDRGVTWTVAVSNVLVKEALGVLNHLLHPLTKDIDVSFNKAVLLQKVLNAHKMLSK